MTTRAVFFSLALACLLLGESSKAQEGAGFLVYSVDLGLAFLDASADVRKLPAKTADQQMLKLSATDSFAAELFQDRKRKIEASKGELSPDEYQKTSLKLELHKRVVAKEIAEARPGVLEAMNRRLFELKKQLDLSSKEPFVIVEAPKWLIPPRSKKCDLTDRLNDPGKQEAPTSPECRYKVALTIQLAQLVAVAPAALDVVGPDPAGGSSEAPKSPLEELLEDVALEHKEALFLAGPSPFQPSCDLTAWAAGALGGGPVKTIREVCLVLAPEPVDPTGTAKAILRSR